MSYKYKVKLNKKNRDFIKLWVYLILSVPHHYVDHYNAYVNESMIIII